MQAPSSTTLCLPGEAGQLRLGSEPCLMGLSGTPGGRHLPQREAQMTLSPKKGSPMDSFSEFHGATQGQSRLHTRRHSRRRPHSLVFQMLGEAGTRPESKSCLRGFMLLCPPLQSFLAPVLAAHPRNCRPPFYPSTARAILCTREWQDLKTHIEHRPCQAFVQAPGLLGRKPFVIQHKYT